MWSATPPAAVERRTRAARRQAFARHQSEQRRTLTGTTRALETDDGEQRVVIRSEAAWQPGDVNRRSCAANEHAVDAGMQAEWTERPLLGGLLYGITEFAVQQAHRRVP